MEPQSGFEPLTCRLQVDCASIAPQGPLRHRGLVVEIAKALDGGHTTNGPIFGAISPRPNCAPIIIRNTLDKVNRSEPILATISALSAQASEEMFMLDGAVCLFYTPGDLH